jgi:anti-anti-sigma factor
MSEERRLIIPGVLERVPEACDFIVAAAEAAGLDERAVYHCQMAVDEWCTNVVEHGFHQHGIRGQIEVNCHADTDKFVIIIHDDSPPFDPMELSEVDPNQPLEEREPGGLGWFFIRKMMDEVVYQYKDGRNSLTMVKNGVPQDAASGNDNSIFAIQHWGNGVWIVTPNCRLDSTVGRQWEATLNSQIEAGHIHLVVDMCEVSYISSSGLKVLLSARRLAEKYHGNIALTSMLPRVREIFEISGFDTLFPILPSVDEAAGYLASHSTAE